MSDRKLLLIVILALVFIFGGTTALYHWAWTTDIKNANDDCTRYNATPMYTKNTRYVCVTADGRIVG